ncbi:M protein, serotype 24 [Enoplosus armatus]|uniref:M protein, serotype 24 n=1 Tax=Enoplosus armatus TaxID=215367 RepID=UPI0039945886
MEFRDHCYTSTIYDKVSPLEFTYKMSSKEIEDFVKLRVSNNYLFSGRRNTSMWAWRAILKHLGLQHKMTHSQASKKWENMKKRYKELKNSPDGGKALPEVWPYFSLMDDAMEGRLEGNAPILKAFPNDKDFLPFSKPKKRKVSMVINSPAALSADGPEIEVSLTADEDGEEKAVHAGSQEIDRIMQEVEHERNMMDSERQVMEREKQVMEREQLVLQRERAVLDREVAALDRDRASLERERATIERDKAVMERERALVEKDRDAVRHDQLALEREKASLAFSRSRASLLSAPKEKTEEVTEDSSMVKDSDGTDRKERFFNLFEKLINNF